MAHYSVKETRVRLGEIMEKIFIEDFTVKYNSISKQVENIADQILQQEQSNTDAYTLLISKNIDNNDCLMNINKTASPLVVFTFFMRYHFVTSHLIQSNQEQTLNFPSDDGDFVEEIFINYWIEILSI